MSLLRFCATAAATLSWTPERDCTIEEVYFDAQTLEALSFDPNVSATSLQNTAGTFQDLTIAEGITGGTEAFSYRVNQRVPAGTTVYCRFEGGGVVQCLIR